MNTVNRKHQHIRRNYIIGLLTSICLTAISFGLVGLDVIGRTENDHWKIGVLILSILAIVQICLQAKYFLDLGSHSSIWKRVFFASMLLALSILFLGSLWIMQNLNYNMMHMSPNEIDQTIIEDEIEHPESMHGSAR